MSFLSRFKVGQETQIDGKSVHAMFVIGGVYYNVRAMGINTRVHLCSLSFIMNAKELNKVARDLTRQAEEILAMAKYFSDLADREALKELREEWQATPPVSEDWDEELRREGEAQAFAIKQYLSANVPGRTGGGRPAGPARDGALTSRHV